MLGLGLQGGAVLSEIFRAGIDAVDRGQREAGISLGLTPGQTMVDVLAPQAIRVVLPPVGNYAIGLLKDTSIASIIAAPDLMLRAKDLASSSFLPMQVYVLVAVFYFAMSYPMSLIVGRLELKLRGTAIEAEKGRHAGKQSRTCVTPIINNRESTDD